MDSGAQSQKHMLKQSHSEQEPQSPYHEDVCDSPSSPNGRETSRQRPLDLRLLPSAFPTSFPTAAAKLASKTGSSGGVTKSSSNTSSPFEEFHNKHAGRRRSTFELTSHKGSCHCGAIKFELRSRPRVKSLLQCTCSVCLKYRDLCLYLKSDKIKLTAGQDKLTCYTYGPGTVTVKFCSVCGVKCFKVIESAPLKLANVLIAIGGAHAPFEENEDVESPGATQNIGSFMMRRYDVIINSATATESTGTTSVGCAPPPHLRRPYSLACAAPESAWLSDQTNCSLSSSSTNTTKSLIGLNICSCIEGNTISYQNILTCDLTSVSWAELKQLLCS